MQTIRFSAHNTTELYFSKSRQRRETTICRAAALHPLRDQKVSVNYVLIRLFCTEFLLHVRILQQVSTFLKSDASLRFIENSMKQCSNLALLLRTIYAIDRIVGAILRKYRSRFAFTFNSYNQYESFCSFATHSLFKASSPATSLLTFCALRCFH